jgi:hypothetical protein
MGETANALCHHQEQGGSQMLYSLTPDSWQTSLQYTREPFPFNFLMKVSQQETFTLDSTLAVTLPLILSDFPQSSSHSYTTMVPNHSNAHSLSNLYYTTTCSNRDITFSFHPLALHHVNHSFQTLLNSLHPKLNAQCNLHQTTIYMRTA